MDVLLALLGGISIGLVVGCIIMILIFKPKDSGVLNVYTANPDEVIEFYVELNEPPETLIDCDYVNFRVRTINV